jgi:hypothetical protein
MTHPITPPPELVQQWAKVQPAEQVVADHWHHIATRAAQWGADQELEACCDLLNEEWGSGHGERLRRFRSPKPPSLKEQALKALHSASFQPGTDFRQIDPTRSATIRRALEALPDD